MDLIEHPGNDILMMQQKVRLLIQLFLTDYLTAVETPMDLRTVKEELLGDNYESEAEFVKDMRLIFTNSRNYNTNKRSRVSNSSSFQFLTKKLPKIPRQQHFA